MKPIPALPADSAERKQYPVYSGFIAYFPHAIAEVSHRSWQGNEQHHPGTAMHWDMDKSKDERDCEMRHMIDALLAPSAEVKKEELVAKAWRAMADLERYLTGTCVYENASTQQATERSPLK